MHGSPHLKDMMDTMGMNILFIQRKQAFDTSSCNYIYKGVHNIYREASKNVLLSFLKVLLILVILHIVYVSFFH